MSTSTTAGRRAARQPMNSPLATASWQPATLAALSASSPAHPVAADPAPRAVMLAEFADYLRTVNNRDGYPYEQTTIGT